MYRQKARRTWLFKRFTPPNVGKVRLKGEEARAKAAKLEKINQDTLLRKEGYFDIDWDSIFGKGWDKGLKLEGYF